MIMKKKVLALSIAAALGGVVGTASAAPAIQEAGVGHALILPYFTTQNGYDTLFSITNTDTVFGKAVKVRFRGAVDSDDIFDFQVFLSPADVWTAKVSKGADGASVMATSDKSCTLPASVNQSFVTARLLSYTDAAGTVQSPVAQTREGYVEIFNMGDIPATLPSGVGSALGATANPLYTATKHVSGVAPCTLATLMGIEAIGGAVVAPVSNGMGAANYTTTQQLVAPTTGLMGNWVIIDVPNTRTFSGGMSAIRAANQTMVVYSGQTGTARTAVNVAAVSGTNTFPALTLTDDAVLLNSANTGVVTADYDFPDMSTPYETDNLTPLLYVTALSNSFRRTQVMNEFFTDSALSAGTDWVLSMPTRRYHVAGRGTSYKKSDGTTGTVGAVYNGGATGPFLGVTTYATDGRSARISTSASATYYNREEVASAGGGAVISPGTPTLYTLNGEVNVLSWNNSGTKSSVIGAEIILANSSTGSQTTGWAFQPTPGAGGLGLPILGDAFLKVANPSASTGVSGNYGISYGHRYR